MLDVKRKRFVYICSKCGKFFIPFVSVPYELVVMNLILEKFRLY